MDKNAQDFCTDCTETRRGFVGKVTKLAVGAGAFVAALGGFAIVKDHVSADWQPSTDDEIRALLDQPLFQEGPPELKNDPASWQQRQHAIETRDIEALRGTVFTRIKPALAAEAACTQQYYQILCYHDCACPPQYKKGAIWYYMCGSVQQCPTCYWRYGGCEWAGSCPGC